MYRVHILLHTHWDREWYLSYQEFRIRLTRLIKKVIELMKTESLSSYHLDGQSIIINDYLEIYPEDKACLEKLIAEGRLKIGPWYVQPDESLVSGEAIIRNLEHGIGIAERMGGSMRVGYLPDMFGHISQLPQIFDGFGIHNVVLWRGVGELNEELSAESFWRGADGTELFMYRLSNGVGYFNIFRLKENAIEAAAQIRGVVEGHLAEKSLTNIMLCMIGTDHMEPQGNIAALLEGAAAHLPDYDLIISSMEGFLTELEAKVMESGLHLTSVSGEMRSTNYALSGQYNFLLANVLSSRIYIKQTNTRCQFQLERWTEPFSAVLDRLENEYPAHFIRQSWDYLLQNHPHDSICGCSQDEVHRQMMTRFEWSQSISRQLTQEALHGLTYRIDTSGLPENRIIFQVYNPLEWERKDAVTAELYFPADTAAARSLDIYDVEGRLLPSQIVGWDPDYRTINHKDTAIRDEAMVQSGVPPEDREFLVMKEYTMKVTVCFTPVAPLPAFGYATFTAGLNPARYPEKSKIVQRKGNTLKLENDYLSVNIQSDGGISILDKLSGRLIENAVNLEDGGDIGDGYTYSPPLIDRVYSTQGLESCVSVIEDGSANGAIRIERNWSLPASLGSDRKRRSDELSVCRQSIDISLGLNNRWVGLIVRFNNLVKDHRLRLAVSTGIAAETSWASAAFDITERMVIVEQPAPEVWIEDATGVYPNQGLAGLTSDDGRYGFAVAPYGLPEYEATLNGDIYVTLLRSVGYLGSPDPLTIINGAGPNFPTPEGQCLGVHEFRLALIPHSGNQGRMQAWRWANEHHLPVQTIQQKRHKGSLPLSMSFLRLIEDGDSKTSGNLVLSSVKKAWNRDSIIVRLFNPTGETAQARLLWWKKIHKCYLTNLEETRIEELSFDDDSSIHVTVGPKKMITFELIDY